LQIFLTGKYKTTEKIKDFFGCGKDMRASRDWRQNPRIAPGVDEIWKNDFKEFQVQPGWIFARENLQMKFADFVLQIFVRSSAEALDRMGFYL
jgi:hypothetical protein